MSAHLSIYVFQTYGRTDGQTNGQRESLPNFSQKLNHLATDIKIKALQTEFKMTRTKNFFM